MKIIKLSTLATMFVTTIDDRYVGSCPADMKPGDAVMADGKKMSLGTP